MLLQNYQNQTSRYNFDYDDQLNKRHEFGLHSQTQQSHPFSRYFQDEPPHLRPFLNASDLPHLPRNQHRVGITQGTRLKPQSPRCPEEIDSQYDSIEIHLQNSHEAPSQAQLETQSFDHRK